MIIDCQLFGLKVYLQIIFLAHRTLYISIPVQCSEWTYRKDGLTLQKLILAWAAAKFRRYPTSLRNSLFFTAYLSRNHFLRIFHAFNFLKGAFVFLKVESDDWIGVTKIGAFGLVFRFILDISAYFSFGPFFLLERAIGDGRYFWESRHILKHGTEVMIERL